MKTDSLHYACFLLCENFQLINVHLVDPQKGIVQFEFQKKPGIDLENLYHTWSLDQYKVPCRTIFTHYARLRELIEMAKRGKSG